MKKSFIVSILVSIITMIIAGWFILKTHGEVPVNWNAAGEVTSYGSSLYLLIFPIVSILTSLLLYFFPRIDPKGANIEKSGPILAIMMLLIVFLMLGIEIFIIMAIDCFDIMNLTIFISVLLGILFIVMGYYMPRVKQNYMVGIRTAWTLDNENVWNKTHEVSRNWYIASGLIFFLSMFFPVPYNIVIPTLFILIVSIGLVIYSYQLFTKEKSAKKRDKKTGA